MSSKYLIKYLELLFVSINFEIIALSASTSQMLVDFFHHKIVLLPHLPYDIPTLLYSEKKLLSLFFS